MIRPCPNIISNEFIGVQSKENPSATRTKNISHPSYLLNSIPKEVCDPFQKDGKAHRPFTATVSCQSITFQEERIRNQMLSWNDPLLNQLKSSDFHSLHTEVDERMITQGFKLYPLKGHHLESAQRLVKKVFPHDAADIELQFAVEGSPYKEFDGNRAVPFAEYWVAVKEGQDDVVGIVGYNYFAEDATDAIWGNWWCVDPNHSGYGIGRFLGLFLSEKILSSGKAYFRLYTEDFEFERNANLLYEKAGIRVVKSEPFGNSGNFRLWREIHLGGPTKKTLLRLGINILYIQLTLKGFLKNTYKNFLTHGATIQ